MVSIAIEYSVHLNSVLIRSGFTVRENDELGMIDPVFDLNCAIINCSRDSNFINLCIKVVESEDLNLRQKINLQRGIV